MLRNPMRASEPKELRSLLDASEPYDGINTSSRSGSGALYDQVVFFVVADFALTCW